MITVWALLMSGVAVWALLMPAWPWVTAGDYRRRGRVARGMERADWDDVADVLRDVHFPANKQDMVNHARQRQASATVLDLIGGLPVGVYRNLVDVRSRVMSRP